MRTLYIDVYFLINFIVDILALYFAVLLSKTPATPFRLVTAAIFGALFASLIIFIPEYQWLKMLLSLASLVLISFIATLRIGMRRRVKFIFAFLIFEALTGGAVYYLWTLLDTYFYDSLSGLDGGSVNRKMLMLAIILLLLTGVFKMLVGVFSSNSTEKSVKIEIGFLGAHIECEALVDSGNLAIDPMDMRPVLFLKPALARRLLPSEVIDLPDPDMLERDVRRRIRLIPVTREGETHVLVGVRTDYVKVRRGKSDEYICVTLAIDKEEGSYGGFEALMPAAAIDYEK